MKLTPVSGSSVIKAHGYDPASGKMRVQTHGGHTYEYEGIPPQTYAAFTGASSPGTFWNKKIQPVHAGKKVGAKE